MALIGNVTEGYIPPLDSSFRVEGAPIAQALPAPPLVWAYTRGFDIEYDISMLDAPFFIPNALREEGTHTEPTKGQIWPRY